MIFVTVGTDMPFDRLIRAVDAWAAANQRFDVFAQIGEGGWAPEHIEHAEFLEPPEFTRRFVAADLIVAHAGMGTILSALRYEKPVLIMPRRASLGEQRNEHQLATAKRLSALRKVDVAYDEEALQLALIGSSQLLARAKIGAYADDHLQASIRDFIWNVKPVSPSPPLSR